jgi:membrane-associated phospholipid phosphatase
LLVTYGVSNDLFFSGHTALAVFGVVELGRFRRSLVPWCVGLAIFEMVAVLALRAHWTMDVYAGAVSALLVALLAPTLARPVDRWLGK